MGRPRGRGACRAGARGAWSRRGARGSRREVRARDPDRAPRAQLSTRSCGGSTSAGRSPSAPGARARTTRRSPEVGRPAAGPPEGLGSSPRLDPLRTCSTLGGETTRPAAGRRAGPAVAVEPAAPRDDRASGRDDGRCDGRARVRARRRGRRPGRRRAAGRCSGARARGVVGGGRARRRRRDERGRQARTPGCPRPPRRALLRDGAGASTSRARAASAGGSGGTDSCGAGGSSTTGGGAGSSASSTTGTDDRRRPWTVRVPARGLGHRGDGVVDGATGSAADLLGSPRGVVAGSSHGRPSGGPLPCGALSCGVVAVRAAVALRHVALRRLVLRRAVRCAAVEDQSTVSRMPVAATSSTRSSHLVLSTRLHGHRSAPLPSPCCLTLCTDARAGQ